MTCPTRLRKSILSLVLALVSTTVWGASDDGPRITEAKAFITNAESQLEAAGHELAHASWLAATYINYDSQKVEALAYQRFLELSVDYANSAARFNDLALEESDRRKMELLKQVLTFPAPSDSEMSRELAEIGSEMSAIYGSGQFCRTLTGEEQECLSGDTIENLMRTSRDPDELLELWIGWREVSPPMKPLYERQVEIGNEGAQQLGYDNLSTFWRSKYDMQPDAFAADADLQWSKVKPFYDALHCHVRAELNDYYGDDVVPATGPIPAHVLGNQWAQDWSAIYDLVAPQSSDLGYNLDQLVEKNVEDAKHIVRIAENFFISLGFEPLPDTFWERSMFTEPIDHQAVCHASAWNLDDQDDLRIKMCIDKNAEEFKTVHHELGHNFYQRAYKEQSALFRGSANDGFHEAIGDTIALSVTPKYLVDIGWLEEEPPIEGDLGYLMNMALDKIAFLPWGLMIDKWRWQVFNGEVSPDEYNQGWWNLREEYQGVKAPVARSEVNFDPGAKYHIPGNTPYMRYFLSYIQQFQFHRALCEAAGFEGALHRCSIYNSKDAGEKLNAMLEMGISRPWQDAMQAMTGQRELDASAIIDYFAPLKEWLDVQNQGRQCGW
ncbi:MAG: M2 family metallopeptidase [Gammaproteobacteria bacterium]|jgi:peptidyl-dipeptidase A|nr:M2 family metallopeptidase [Gammaproteobacteria bacterium]MBT6043087.1 M2 family metallopeptidase [Gammaproteobacteria bacterium]